MRKTFGSALANCVGLCAVMGVASVSPASASTIPYPNKGTQAPAQPLVAQVAGELVAYFYGSTAVFSNSLGLEVNGVLRASGVFANHTTAQGTAFDFGSVNAGDALTFFIDSTFRNRTNTFYSDQGMNADGVNHAYSTDYQGGVAGIPAGTFVGFEDVRGGGDLNYNDETFVFAVNPMAVPLPASAPLFGAALVAFGFAGYGVSRRKNAKAA